MILHRILPLCLLAGAALPAQASRPAELRPEAIAREGQGLLLRAGGQRVLCVKGTPREIGFQHGKLLAAEVRTVVAETLEWTYAHGLARTELQSLLTAAQPYLPRRYEEEMRGLAEGSGTPLEDVRLVHMMPSRFHCTGAAAARAATRDGKLYHLRSLDYALDIGTGSRLQEHALLIVREDEDGIPSIVPSWAGVLGAVTGMNGAGISVGEMGSQCRDEDQCGIPMIFLVREVLRRATTLAQAVEIFRAGPSTCGYHFVVGSGDESDAVAIEVARSRFVTFALGDPKESKAPHTPLPDVVRRSNHFVDEELAKSQREPYDPRQSRASSWMAYERMTRFLAERRGRIDAPALIELLRTYPKAHGCLHQAVMCPADRFLWVAQARDDRRAGFAGAQNQDFLGYDLRALLRRDLSVPVRVERAAEAPAAAPREAVVPGDGESRIVYHLQETQRDAQASVTLAEPDDPSRLPRLEVFAPASLPKAAPGALLFSSGEPNQIASKVLARELAVLGVPTLVVPLITGTPLDVRATVRLAAGLDALLPPCVERSRVACIGLGLGAGPALTAAGARRPELAVLAFTTLGLAERVGEDAAIAGGLGFLLPDARRRVKEQLGPMLRDALGSASATRLLVLALEGESRLPVPDQRALLALVPKAEAWWSTGSLRALQRDAAPAARRIAEFLAKP